MGAAVSAMHLCWKSIITRDWCRKKRQSARPRSDGSSERFSRCWQVARDALAWHGGKRARFLFGRIGPAAQQVART